MAADRPKQSHVNRQFISHRNNKATTSSKRYLHRAYINGSNVILTRLVNLYTDNATAYATEIKPCTHI